MKVSYRGIQERICLPKLQEKLDAKFAKLSKLLEQRGEKEAHVVVTSGAPPAQRRNHACSFTIISWSGSARTPTCSRR